MAPVLLQKLQPLFVIVFSRLILKEKIGLKLLSLVPLALIGSYMISFGTDGVELQLKGKELIYILSVGAAFCWGFGTILSKYLLRKLSFSEATSLRFFLAIPISLIVMIINLINIIIYIIFLPVINGIIIIVITIIMIIIVIFVILLN